MSTYRELVYLTLDEIKGLSDDTYYTEDHIIFLLGKYRAFLLKQRYSDIKKPISTGNYQTICLDLIEVPAICGEPCEGGSYLRSKEKVPTIMGVSNTRVYGCDYFQGEIAYVSRDRMRYVGNNRYLQNIIYSSRGTDDYLYLKSSNPQFLHLEQIKMTAIFEDAIKASNLSCEESEICDILDKEFPIEESLIPPLVELVFNELVKGTKMPDDKDNNSTDDKDININRYGE